MTKINRILTICAAIAMCMAAHAASLPVGYCYGEIAETGLSKVGKATVSGAIVIPNNILCQYQGATVSGIRVGLVTADGITGLRGWVRSDLSGENLDEASFPESSAGWNETSLNGGIIIDGSQLVAGFSFEQEKSVKCLSVVGENNDDARWIAKNDNWELAKTEGVLSIELLLTGDNIPDKDIMLLSLTSPEMPVKSGNDMIFNAVVRNMTLNPVHGFDLSYTIDGMSVVTTHHDDVLVYGQKEMISFYVPSGTVKDDTPYSMNVTVSCDRDGISTNNSTSIQIGAYTESWQRKVLIEEFTTEKCGNCPRAINTLKQCEEAGYGDRMAVVAHHVGYDTDWLTVPEDETYLWFYDPSGKEGTFAPAAMLDRTVLEGESTPVNSVGYFSDFEPILQEAINVPAFVRLDVESSFENDNTISISTYIEKMPMFEAISENPRLTVYIIEDDILHHDQAGISSDSFTHSHVYRKCITDLWGNHIKWDNNNAASMVFSIPIEESWNRDNLTVVAFVNDYNPTDINKCRVHNTTIARAGSSGIKSIAAESIVKVEYYTLDGIKLDCPSDGIYIRIFTLSNGSTIREKVIGL